MIKFVASLILLVGLGILCTLAALRVELQEQSGNHAGHEQNLREPHPYPQELDSQLRQIAQQQGINLQRSPQRALPAELQWQNGLGEPEIGDPAALKGGRIRIANAGPYPKHFLPFGGVDLSFFNFTLYKNVEMKLLALHPSTGRIIPALAEQWAEHGQDIYYKINPEARYSNGRPLRAGDFLLAIALRSSPYAQDPFYMTALQEKMEAIESIGDYVLRVRLRQKTLLAPAIAAEKLYAAEPSFYAEFGSDYLTRYKQRVAPTTGGYTLHTEHIERGRQITISRVKNWWAAKLPYYCNSCNVDSIEINFLQDEAQMWELFLNKRLDIIQSRNISTWKERTECPAVWQGQIEKRIFKANYPMPPYGIYLNCATLTELELRRGIMAALDMDSAIARIYQGEGERLTCYSEGYGSISPTNISQQSYKPEEARAHFAQMGYREAGTDGILRNDKGDRLSHTLIYTPSQKIDTLVQILVSQAKACGLEIKPLAQPWQKAAEQVESKQYQLCFWADVAASPLPDITQIFHSRYLHTRAKNIFSIADEQLDCAIEEMEKAENIEQLTEATGRANERIAQLAIWQSGWKENSAYIANWRQLRFPDTEECKLSTPTPYEVMEAHLYWIDPSYSNHGQHPEIDERVDASQQHAR